MGHDRQPDTGHVRHLGDVPSHRAQYRTRCNAALVGLDPFTTPVAHHDTLHLDALVHVDTESGRFGRIAPHHGIVPDRGPGRVIGGAKHRPLSATGHVELGTDLAHLRRRQVGGVYAEMLILQGALALVRSWASEWASQSRPRSERSML